MKEDYRVFNDVKENEYNEEEYLTDVLKEKNNYVKKILSNENGMTNFDRARNRIMYSQNLLDTYTISINKKQIKKNKNK
ncbi:hypothetical protein MBAG_03565 [Coprobacillus sp. D7]|nr:hypothetical protein MBAG_03565 [Coprobacillus sp. D7]